MNGYSIPKATLGRLPQYLQYLKSLPVAQCETISATVIAKGLSLGDVQVRKDLATVSGTGKPRIGYERKKLIEDIEQHLRCGRLTNAVLVGAGKLGRALLDYKGFETFGVRVVAGFDCDEKAVRFGEISKKILPMEEITAYCTDNDVKLGIITVSQGAAQAVCDRLVLSGIKAIWNFTPCDLKVPAGVLVKHENLALSLAYLNNQISESF